METPPQCMMEKTTEEIPPPTPSCKDQLLGARDLGQLLAMLIGRRVISSLVHLAPSSLVLILDISRALDSEDRAQTYSYSVGKGSGVTKDYPLTPVPGA